jgi:hypothetical protein
MTTSSSPRSLITVFVFAMLAGCSSNSSVSGHQADGGGGDQPNGGGGTLGALGDLCSTSAPCASGLSCSTKGSLLGRCTADCSSDLGLCAAQFGANAVCLDASQCAITCTSVAQCPGSAGASCVALTSGDSACITNPNGPPGAAPLPNGACENVGGAFGDSIQNGGYRCTPTSGQEAMTGIDQCENGRWVTAYNCTCTVPNGTFENPSSCTDFNAPGAAVCEYAFQSCAECTLGEGCQATP